jgi:hypothetical protein
MPSACPTGTSGTAGTGLPLLPSNCPGFPASGWTRRADSGRVHLGQQVPLGLADPGAGFKMTAGRSIRWLLQACLAGGALAVCAAAGCRWFDRSGGLARGDRPDPLFGTRIPATDLPIPGRGEGYGQGRSDPLLASPTGRGERSSRTDREPFRLGPENTTAGLAGRLRPEETGLSIGERPERNPNAGAVLLRPTDRGTAGGMTYTQITEELTRFGATWSEPIPEGDEYVFRADVPIEGGVDGALRRYEGVGSTPASAAKQVLDQVKEDRGL